MTVERAVDERAAGAVTAVARRVGAWALALLPTRRLALLLVLLAPLWLLTELTGSSFWPWIVVLLVALLVVADLLSLPAPWQLEVERRVPANIGLGDEVHATYAVASRAGRALRFSLYDALPRALESAEPRGTWRTLAAGERVEIPLTLVGRERGTHEMGPVVLRVLGALGLVQRQLRYAIDDAVTVTPSLAGVRRYRLLSLQHRLREAGVRAIRRRGEGTNFASLREYVVGDDPRRIDWKATARRATLITREYSVEQGQTVMLAVDAGRMMTQLSGSVPRFEYALSSATLLADVAVQSGDNVGLILFDDEVRAFVPPERGAGALQRVRDALIPARATMAEPDYASAFRLLATRHRRRSLIVMFTDVIDVRASQALIAHTTRSAQRHLLVVVALRNDRLMEAAVPTAESTSTQLYESAAAEELVLAREEALVRMRRAGVSVLDVSPQAMTAAVINRYLEIKARASL